MRQITETTTLGYALDNYDLETRCLVVFEGIYQDEAGHNAEGEEATLQGAYVHILDNISEWNEDCTVQFFTGTPDVIGPAPVPERNLIRTETGRLTLAKVRAQKIDPETIVAVLYNKTFVKSNGENTYGYDLQKAEVFPLSNTKTWIPQCDVVFFITGPDLELEAKLAKMAPLERLAYEAKSAKVLELKLDVDEINKFIKGLTASSAIKLGNPNDFSSVAMALIHPNTRAKILGETKADQFYSLVTEANNIIAGMKSETAVNQRVVKALTNRENLI
jgi:hypothetical protein